MNCNQEGKQESETQERTMSETWEGNDERNMRGKQWGKHEKETQKETIKEKLEGNDNGKMGVKQ